jgi:DNA-binding NtrC family response regulator
MVGIPYEHNKDGRKPQALEFKGRMANGESHSLPEPIPHILVVDDDPLIRHQIERLYSHKGYNVALAATAEDALERLKAEDIDLVVTDIHLPGISGTELTERMQRLYPDVPVIVITGYADIGNAVEVLKLGANDYIVKPFSAAAIQESTQGVLEKARAFTEIRHLRRLLKDRYEFGGMLSKTTEMHRVFEVIRLVAGTDATVLVEGETGTGKELVASAIHHQSPRRNGPFVPINCAGFPETLLESELFGYERGAFTGANQSRLGKIELAHRGTLFLDEIESMPLSMQAKLLLVLQDQKVQRLGATRRTQIDMRVIAASNMPLEDLVSRGQMRSDFYYRINVVPIRLIPLRQRREDIPLLVQDFLRHHQVAVRKGITQVSRQAMDKFLQYAWLGNVRELHNVLERAIVLTTGRVIEKVDLPETRLATLDNGQGCAPATLPLREWLAEQEKHYLLQQLEACGGKIGLTASVCGVDTKTLYRKMRSYGLDKKVFRG